MPRGRRPKGILIDYGGTLVEEVDFAPQVGSELLLTQAVSRPPHVSLESVLDRAATVSTQVAALRDQFHVETPWPLLTRLIYDFFNVRFESPMSELEMAFWKASVRTRPMPGACEALEEFQRRAVPIAVVSNCGFGSDVLRYELGKHGLAAHLAFIMVSAEYAVRKPNGLLFETAAAKLGVAPEDIWFVGDRLDTDIVGAKAVGMTAVWFRPPKDAPLDCADLTVADWTELVGCFQAAR